MKKADLRIYQWYLGRQQYDGNDVIFLCALLQQIEG